MTFSYVSLPFDRASAVLEKSLALLGAAVAAWERVVESGSQEPSLQRLAVAYDQVLVARDDSTYSASSRLSK